jgi:hypothetical protein
MMMTVREKLSGHRWPPLSPAKFGVSTVAVLSARLFLDISPISSQARQIEAELVRGHLRVLYSVREDLQTMVTGSSTEPLIAEAAAQIFNHTIDYNGNKEPYMNIWRILGEFVEQGLSSQGVIGELIGRTLSILAMDRAINALPSSEHCELKFQTPITVTSYYAALLTDEAWEKLRRSIPANYLQLSEKSATTTFEDAFAEAYFHFSHYAMANDGTPFQDTSSWAHWMRGTAVICQLGQEAIDSANPIYFPKSGPISPQTMSMQGNQYKTGIHADPLFAGIQDAKTLGYFSEGRQMPYIAAVHCFALTKKEGIDVTTSNRYPHRHQERDKEAPRYQIHFLGLAAYRDISAHVKNDIHRMIDGSKDVLFKHHPRPYGLQLLRQMQPVLQGHEEATAWFRNIQAQGKGKEPKQGNRTGSSHAPNPSNRKRKPPKDDPTARKLPRK